MMRPFLFIITVLSTLISSCIQQTQQENDIRYIEREKKSFVYLKRLLHIETLDEFIIVDNSFASGVCVNSNVYHDFKTIVSVEHFCATKKLVLVNIVKELSDFYEIKENEVLDMFYTIEGIFYDGTAHEMKVLKTDAKNDLCILTFSDKNTSCLDNIKLTRSFPEQGEQLHNLAAPMSIFTKENVLIFSGYYGGLDNNNDMMLTIPATYGSSGSPIFNKKGQLVSIITKMIVKFNNVSIGVNTDKIMKFVNERKDK